MLLRTRDNDLFKVAQLLQAFHVSGHRDIWPIKRIIFTLVVQY